MDLQANAAAQEVAAQSRGACDVLKGRPHSSNEDPNFMNTYFKSSRLHFIGTWKARIEALSARMAPTAPVPAQMVGVKLWSRWLLLMFLLCWLLQGLCTAAAPAWQ